jgi:hypothetical protein
MLTFYFGRKTLIERVAAHRSQGARPKTKSRSTIRPIVKICSFNPLLLKLKKLWQEALLVAEKFLRYWGATQVNPNSN